MSKDSCRTPSWCPDSWRILMTVGKSSRQLKNLHTFCEGRRNYSFFPFSHSKCFPCINLLIFTINHEADSCSEVQRDPRIGSSPHSCTRAQLSLELAVQLQNMGPPPLLGLAPVRDSSSFICRHWLLVFLRAPGLDCLLVAFTSPGP